MYIALDSCPLAGKGGGGSYFLSTTTVVKQINLSLLSFIILMCLIIFFYIYDIIYQGAQLDRHIVFQWESFFA